MHKIPEINDLLDEINIKNINSVIQVVKEKGDKQLLEIYSQRMQLKELESELKLFDQENELILKQLNEIIYSESKSFLELGTDFLKESENIEIIKHFFEEMENILNENLNVRKEEMKLSLENQNLKNKKIELEENLKLLEEKNNYLQTFFNDFFLEKDKENNQRMEVILELESQNKLKNDEIQKIVEEKKKMINDYEAKLNLKNIRLELEIDDYKRNRNTEDERKNINENTKILSKTKFHESFILNDSFNGSTMIKKK